MSTAAVSALLYFYQDQIVQRFVTEANRYIATPVQVRKVSLSLLEQFPRVAVTFDQVYIPGSLEEYKEPLVEAAQLHFSFNLWQLLQGHYVIDRVLLHKAHIYLHETATGTNYSIFRSPAADISPTTDAAALRFDLDHITLSDVHLTYTDETARQYHKVWTNRMKAVLKVSGEVYDIKANGEMLSEGIGIEEDTYFKGKLLTLDALLHYNHVQRHLSIAPSTLKINQGSFVVEGVIDQADKMYIDLAVNGKQTDFQTLLSFLPQSMAQQMTAYRSEGNVYFNGKVSGNFSSEESPAVEVNFGCRQASFYHPDYQKKLNDVSLTGSFTNGARRSLITSELILQDIEATLDGKSIHGDFSIRNFRKYLLSCRADAELDINSLLAFYPVPELASASGLVSAHFSMAGSLEDLQNPHAYRQQRVKSSGDITLKDVSFQLKDAELPFHSWNGNFMFRNNDLSLNNLSGYLGNSHFLLNGLFRNALAYVLTDHQFISIEADLRSKLIDADELLSGNLSTAASPQKNVAASAASNWNATIEKQPYQFSIDPRLVLNFTCDIEKLKFRRLKGKNVKGSLSIKEQVATVKNMSIQAAGGSIAANGTVDTHSNNILVASAATFKHLHMDSIFYVFEEFGQDFLTSRQLKGYAYADVNWHMQFDKSLHLDYPSLRIDALTTIKEGQLNNFEPMQRLSRFVEEQNLTHMRFAEMSNRIRIAHETIFIPRMMVSSNVSDIFIEGTHTFSNQIDYHFEVPMRSFSLRKAAVRERAAQREQSFGAVAADDARSVMLFLKATGSVDDYKINYDMGAAHEQFKSNLQEEKKELKEVFEHKGKKPKQKIQLEEDEYFDFSKKTD